MLQNFSYKFRLTISGSLALLFFLYFCTFAHFSVCLTVRTIDLENLPQNDLLYVELL